jgi:hypothetical protein
MALPSAKAKNTPHVGVKGRDGEARQGESHAVASLSKGSGGRLYSLNFNAGTLPCSLLNTRVLLEPTAVEEVRRERVAGGYAQTRRCTATDARRSAGEQWKRLRDKKCIRAYWRRNGRNSIVALDMAVLVSAPNASRTAERNLMNIYLFSLLNLVKLLQFLCRICGFSTAVTMNNAVFWDVAPRVHIVRTNVSGGTIASVFRVGKIR